MTNRHSECAFYFDPELRLVEVKGVFHSRLDIFEWQDKVAIVDIISCITTKDGTPTSCEIQRL
jgi:hypothetical protein